jgi:hypothetical protein
LNSKTKTMTLTKNLTLHYAEGHNIIDVFEPIARVIVKFEKDGYWIEKVEYSVIINGVEVDITDNVNSVMDKPCNAKIKAYLKENAQWEVDNNQELHNEALADMGMEDYDIRSNDLSY